MINGLDLLRYESIKNLWNVEDIFGRKKEGS